jgi:hypothetical protein
MTIGLIGCLCSLAAGNVSIAVNIAAATVRARDIIGNAGGKQENE